MYESVLPETNIRYTMECLHVNGEIVLNNVPEEDCYILNLDTKGLPARLNEDKSITVYDPETGEEEFYIKAPFMYDENLEECHNIGVELVETEIGYDVILTLDKEWLMARGENISTIVQHVIKNSSQDTSNIDDTYVHPGDYAKQHWGEISWKVGVQNGQVHRAFLKIRKLPELPAGYCLEDPNSDQDEHSYLHLTLVNGTTTTINIQEYGIDSAWSPDTITWNKHNNMNYTYYGDSFAFGVERHQIWVHDQPQRYYTEKGQYHGLYFKSTDETYQDWNQMYSGNYSGASSRPYMEIHYAILDKGYECMDANEKCHMSGGVTFVSYYIHPGLNSRMENLIENAAAYWQQALNKAGISATFTRTNDALKSKIRFYDKGLLDKGLPAFGSGEAARTVQYYQHLPINPWEGNWDYSKIFINQDYMPRLDDYDGAGTMAHEMGHAFGLNHTYNSYALMTQIGGGRVVYKPQSGEIAGIRKLYGV